jgi:hypothetical protein
MLSRRSLLAASLLGVPAPAAPVNSCGFAGLEPNRDLSDGQRVIRLGK